MPPHSRTTTGRLRWGAMDRSGAARDYRRALEVSRNATPAERARDVYCCNPTTGARAVVWLAPGADTRDTRDSSTFQLNPSRFNHRNHPCNV